LSCMRRLVLLLIAVLLSPAPISHAGVAAVWAVSDGEKVARRRPQPSAPAAAMRSGTARPSSSSPRGTRSWRSR
jgi:hypothetical protein